MLRGRYRIPFYMSTECEQLLKRFLMISPTKRASLEEIMSDVCRAHRLTCRSRAAAVDERRVRRASGAVSRNRACGTSNLHPIFTPHLLLQPNDAERLDTMERMGFKRAEILAAFEVRPAPMQACPYNWQSNAYTHLVATYLLLKHVAPQNEPVRSF